MDKLIKAENCINFKELLISQRILRFQWMGKLFAVTFCPRQTGIFQR